VVAFLWIPVTLAASGFQVARNALQRRLMTSAGAWGATLVRFLFGLPFSILFIALALVLTPQARPSFSLAFWIAAMAGALAQLLATASLLVAMRRAGFAIGTALQQSSVPLSAVVGLLVFGDDLSAAAWTGVWITTSGLITLTWPEREASGPQPLTGALFGLVSGLCFGFSLNAFRHAALSLEPHHRLFAAVVSVGVVQTAQAAALSAYLALRDRAALAAVIAGWRQSLGAGLCGACASCGWFFASTLAPAAAVRSVGLIEAPMAALAGRRMFAERLTTRQLLAGAAVLIGVILTAFR
jgi:drug/metabolite transporter (DMT)-like permease